MCTEVKEIKQAIREIERNLLLLSTNASRDLSIAVDQGQKTMDEFNDFNLPNIIKAIK